MVTPKSLTDGESHCVPCPGTTVCRMRKVASLGFGDAPRWLRILGVGKIPDLLEALIKSTEETTKKIKTKTAEANQLATAIAQAAGKKPPTWTEMAADAITNADVVPSPLSATIAEMAKNATVLNPLAAMVAEAAKTAALVTSPMKTAAEMAKNSSLIAEVAKTAASGAEAAKRLTPTWSELKKSSRRGK